MSKYAALILPGPDWIQLTNIQHKLDKHKDVLLCTKTTIAGENLDGIEKVYVIGHGDKDPAKLMMGITAVELAELLSHTSFKEGKLRLDTCYSAYDKVTSAAPQVAAELRKKGLTGVVVSGTLGPSITGWNARRGVVADVEVEKAAVIQTALMILHEGQLAKAEELTYRKWKETLTSAEIAKLAGEVSLHTTDFFDDFLAVLAHPDFSGLLQDASYKEYFKSE